MATYKLIQDIEAEDHILGPLTLRQFIFALISVFFIYMCYLSVAKHFVFMLAVFLPPALFCGFFAVPFGMDQPTETWALAKIRYLFKPRIRVWNQSGVKEMVTITAPKRTEALPAIKGFSQTEVKSRLKALADTIDSRGWAVKNVNPFMPQPVADSDRLLDISSLPQEVPEVDNSKATDILDAGSSPLAHQFDTMIDQSTRQHRQQLMNQLNDIRDNQPAPAAQREQPDSYWFMRPSTASGPVRMQAAAPAPSVPAVPMSSSDASLAQQLKNRQASRAAPYEHLRTLQPVGSQSSQPSDQSLTVTAQPSDSSTSGMTTPGDPDILGLANNNDLSVTALAHEAERTKAKKQEPPQDEEVVISLR